MNSSILFDLHTHSVSSGHGSSDTITAMAKAASIAGLKALGISEHGPATPGSAKESYFRNLSLACRKHFDVRLLYGVELNILNSNGDVDLDDEILEKLDYALISFHLPTCPPMSKEENTSGYIRAMNHKNVRFIGHMDDGRYPADYQKVLQTAKTKGIYPEINNMSLVPEAYRTNGHANSREILEICKVLELPVLLSSDSHGKSQVGNMEYIFPLLKEVNFPQELILNCNLHFLDRF